MFVVDTTIIIPTFNGCNVLEACLRSLALQKNKNFNVLVVDNGSTDKTITMIEDVYPSAVVLPLGSNLGFAKAVNIGIKSVFTPYVLLLNNDTIAEPDFIDVLVGSIQSASHDIAAFNPMVLSIDGSKVENCGFYLDNKWRAHHIYADVKPSEVKNEIKEIFGVNAGASVFRMDFFKDVGYFDDDFFAYYEDVDLSIRGRARGWKYFCAPQARVLHHHSHTGNSFPGLKNFYLRRNYLWYVIKNASVAYALKLILALVLKDVGNAVHHLKSSQNREYAKIIIKAYFSTIMSLRGLIKKRFKNVIS